jgi:DNA-binding Lrp family transcriptional regulator
MTRAETETRIMKILLKDFALNSTITSLAKEMEMSRVGVWKALKKLEFEKFIILAPIGTGKTSAYRIKLNWENRLVEKTLALALEREAVSQRRWAINFSELEGKVDFLILFGSILHSPQKANDIDILSIVSKKNVSMKIENIVMKVQTTQLKHIHNIIFAPAGLRDELKKPNIAFINALKEGIVLFGQDKFMAFMREMQQ